MASVVVAGGALGWHPRALEQFTQGTATEAARGGSRISIVTSRDGTAIAFERTGEGPPVVLVDGAFCYRANGPSRTRAALLAPHFTVFAYDRRGRDGSGDTPPYAVAREVEDLAALMAETGESASLFGLSSGAALALEAAAVGLNSSGRRGEAVEYFLTRVMGMPAEAIPPMRAAPVWPALEGVAPTLAYDAALAGDESLLAERAAAVEVPTLAIHGDNSPAPLRNAAEAVAATVPGARRHSLVGQGHDVAMDVLAPVLADFFD